MVNPASSGAKASWTVVASPSGRNRARENSTSARVAVSPPVSARTACAAISRYPAAGKTVLPSIRWSARYGSRSVSRRLSQVGCSAEDRRPSSGWSSRPSRICSTGAGSTQYRSRCHG